MGGTKHGLCAVHHEVRCRQYRQRNDLCRHEQVAPIVTAQQILPAGTVAIHLSSRLQVLARPQRGL